MNNYEYIIAGLPVLRAGGTERLDAGAVLDEIRSQLSPADAKALDFVLEGWNPESLTPEFYARAEESRNAFIKGYFHYDRLLRNAKVAWLNKELGRPAGQDVMGDPDEEFEDAAKAAEVLSGSDIIGREKGLDNLLWEQIDALTAMHVFDIDVILGFAVRLKITERWLRLDPAAGRELFEKMVAELKARRIQE